MSNKTSDKNVENIETVIKDCREHLKLYGEAFITADELDRIEKILAEREQMLREKQDDKQDIKDFQNALNEENLRCANYAIENNELKKRIQELEAKLLDMIQGTEIINKETPEYVKENYIPKQVIKDKIEKIIGETTPTPILKPKIEWQPWDYERVYKIQPLFELLEGEK